MLTVNLHPYQEDAVDKGVERGSLLIAYEMGLGKEQPVSEPVLTPTGWRPIGDVVPGDSVIGRDGQPTRVLGVYSQGVKDVFRVTFSDGSWTRAGGQHLWEVRTNNDHARGTHRTLTTDEIREHGLRDGAGNRRYRIPVVLPVEFPERDLDLDPYLLGVLIGDGSIKRQAGFSSADDEIVVEVENRCPTGVVVKHVSVYDYRIVGTTFRVNPVTQALRALRLFGHGSESKFIPDAYKTASVGQRTLLLQGLLDTDGHVRPEDNNIEYCTVSRRLADDVVDLVRSLGGTARVREKRTARRLAYRMSIALPSDVLPFRLTRKAAAYHPRPKYQPTRLIESIEPDGREESVCIYVSAEDHLYVTRDYVVTHNTIIALAITETLLGEGEIQTTVVVVPSSLKFQWAESIGKHTDVDTYERELRLDGEKQKLKLPTEEFCVVIDGPPKKRAEQYARVRSSRPDYVIMSYENVVNDWSHVRRIKPECIVLDEATAIKTFKAQRTRKIKRFQAPYRFALTGTPIENGKPEELFSIMQWVDDEVLGRFDLFDKTFIVRDGFGGVKRYKNLPVLHARLSQAMVRKTRQDEDVKPFLPKVQEEIVPVSLDKPTKDAYNTIAADLLRELQAVQPGAAGSFDIFTHYHGGDGHDENTATGRIMARMQALDMLLNHPRLLELSADRYYSGMKEREAGSTKKSFAGSKYAFELCDSGLLDDIHSQPKLDAAVEDIQYILASDDRNKLIVFSYSPDMLQLIEDSLPGVGCVQYHGGMNSTQKAAAKAKYANDPGCRVFLSSHAGAFGTDLYMANYLLNYDLAWSAGKQDQINMRHDRASSLFEHIFIRNTIVTGSVEQRKYQALALKRKVGSAIMDNRGADDKGRVVNDLTTLTDFLKASTLSA